MPGYESIDQILAQRGVLTTEGDDRPGKGVDVCLRDGLVAFFS
jgi:hypothetical protein